LRLFKTKEFMRFARRQRISDASLRESIQRAEGGLIDAQLGGGVIKQRLPRPGQGRSGGYRVLIAYRPQVLSVSLHGFAKNERDNIDDNELATLRDIARSWFQVNATALSRAVADGLIQEVAYGGEKKG
jgi:hypothetical protein